MEIEAVSFGHGKDGRRERFSFPFGAIRLREILMRIFDLLGTPLLATTYEELIGHVQALVSEHGVSAVDFTNTQIIALRRHDLHFREITRDLDYFIPDGMPLVWCLNARGARLRDRVYGPTFMRRCLEASPAPWKHYLVGGSEKCGRQLRERFRSVQFVGSYHGLCDESGSLGGADEAVMNDINRTSPDFIWVGLGTPKQYEWIHRHAGRIGRGVIFTVGFAFDVNAGLKPDAPAWMQRAALTWLFRAGSEPRRLVRRYLRFNTLFLYYLLRDAFAPPTA